MPINHGNGAGGVGGGLVLKGNDAECIIEVWAKNLEEEFARMRQIVQEYPYISMVRINVHVLTPVLREREGVKERERERERERGSVVFFYYIFLINTGHRVPWCSGEADRRLW